MLNDLPLRWAVGSKANIDTSGTDFCFMREREADEPGRWATEVEVLNRGGDLGSGRAAGFPFKLSAVELEEG